MWEVCEALAGPHLTLARLPWELKMFTRLYFIQPLEHWTVVTETLSQLLEWSKVAYSCKITPWAVTFSLDSVSYLSIY